MLIKIGYIRDYYPDRRCIINKIDKNVVYTKIKNEDKIREIYRVLRKLKLKKNNPREYNFKSKVKNVDIIHSFNYVCETSMPWISTFETILPRREEILHFHHEISEYKITENVKKDILLIASDNCKKIIALSECNRKIQDEFLKKFDKEIQEKIKRKIIVIKPPQKLLLTKEELIRKFANTKNEIKFLFIGNQFFRKGGEQIINVFNKLIKKYKSKIKLIIISNITPDLEFTRINDGKAKERVIKFINDNEEHIQWYQNLENDKVLEIAKECDVGLLPTFADTYGYSVLEMQAAGMPVITTNVRAMPEINNAGWICKIPINKFGEALYSKEDSLNETKEILEKELERIVREILEDTDIIKKKGLDAYEYISKNHNPIDYGNKLYEIYVNA